MTKDIIADIDSVLACSDALNLDAMIETVFPDNGHCTKWWLTGAICSCIDCSDLNGKGYYFSSGCCTNGCEANFTNIPYKPYVKCGTYNDNHGIPDKDFILYVIPDDTYYRYMSGLNNTFDSIEFLEGYQYGLAGYKIPNEQYHYYSIYYTNGYMMGKELGDAIEWEE